MKVSKLSMGALAILAATIGAGSASAASLGAIEFKRFTDAAAATNIDLGGVRADIADALVTHNDFNGAPTLPGGLPNNYSIHIDHTYLGDGNTATGDWVLGRYWFKLDPTTMAGAATSWADATLDIVTGYDTGMVNVTFTLFQADEDGYWDGTGPVGHIFGEGNILLADLTPGQKFMMQVSGYLKTGAAATDVGRYDIVLGLTPMSPVPIPPAFLLLLTGIGAMFGYGRVRRKVTAQ